MTHGSSNGQTDPALARKPVEEEKKAKSPAPKALKCDTAAQRWGQDTTCSKWDSRKAYEMGEGKMAVAGCCNTWPLSVETYARSA